MRFSSLGRARWSGLLFKFVSNKSQATIVRPMLTAQALRWEWQNVLSDWVSAFLGYRFFSCSYLFPLFCLPSHFPSWTLRDLIRSASLQLFSSCSTLASVTRDLGNHLDQKQDTNTFSRFADNRWSTNISRKCACTLILVTNLRLLFARDIETRHKWIMMQRPFWPVPTLESDWKHIHTSLERVERLWKVLLLILGRKLADNFLTF